MLFGITNVTNLHVAIHHLDLGRGMDAEWVAYENVQSHSLSPMVSVGMYTRGPHGGTVGIVVYHLDQTCRHIIL